MSKQDYLDAVWSLEQGFIKADSGMDAPNSMPAGGMKSRPKRQGNPRWTPTKGEQMMVQREDPRNGEWIVQQWVRRWEALTGN